MCFTVVRVAAVNLTSAPVLRSTSIAFQVVLCRLRYKSSLRDLAELFLLRGFTFTHEAVREWEEGFTQFVSLAKDNYLLPESKLCKPVSSPSKQPIAPPSSVYMGHTLVCRQS